MTKSEALKAMQDGNKIRHLNYMDDEFVFLNESGKLETEDGVIHGTTDDDFWKKRQNWEDGWDVRLSCISCCSVTSILHFGLCIHCDQDEMDEHSY